MFKINDRVIFVGCDDNLHTIFKSDKKLTNGKEYTVYYVYTEDINEEYILVSEASTPSYKSTAFISIKEYRKQKLNKLCSNQDKL